MFLTRTLRWPEDRPLLLDIDGSYTTARIYRLNVNGHTVALRQATIDPPLTKTFPLPGDVDLLPTLDTVRVALDGDAIMGFAAAKQESWNRRAVLEHIYVSAGARGKGAGRLLIAAICEDARAWGCRCLWAETQTTNYGAIQFYERLGLSLCGFDTSLYDPASGSEEVAVFFARDL